jgi:hypothetical protein
VEKLADYIVVTEPLLSKATLTGILAVTEGIEWRVPKHQGYDRTCTSFPLSLAVSGGYPLPQGRLDAVRQADHTLVKVTRQALRRYGEKYPIHTQSDSGFDILRYETGQRIDSHVDDDAPRVLAMSIALNDSYSGGEFQFWQRETIRLTAGCAIMFPPNFMYPHQILPVTAGTRYAMITWFV